MQVKTEWQVGTEYRNIKGERRRYLCVYVLNDGRPVFVVTNDNGMQSVDTRTPSGRVKDGEKCVGDIDA